MDFPALVERRLLPAGPAYLDHVRRAIKNLTFEEHDRLAEEERKRHKALLEAGTPGEDDLGVGEEEESEELLSLDPKEWKVRGLCYESQVIESMDSNSTETRSLRRARLVKTPLQGNRRANKNCP
jgi:hypothetical protein